MGPCGHVPVSSGSLIAAAPAAADFDAFPSPASPSDGLDTPSTHSLLTQQSPGFLKPQPSAFDHSAAVALPTEPEHVFQTQPTISTPLPVDNPLSSMNLLVGGALAPVHTYHTPPPRPLRPDPGLRLPSFQALGIAAPHPDRFANLSLYGIGQEAATSGAEASLHSHNLEDAGLSAAFESTCLSPKPKPSMVPKFTSEGGQSSLHHDLAALTPPAEKGEFRFAPITTISTTAMDSPATDPGMATQAATPEERSGADQMASPAAPSPVEGAWIEGALRIVLQNTQAASTTENPLRVLSHALPSPTPAGHAFPRFIEAIHNATRDQPTVWINVFHAVQGRFNLADLPSSPPSTPGPAIGGEDYFTQKVFDSAVSISDYQQDLSSLPRSPRPIVPPSSINVSIVERYIPPATSHEFSDMFNMSGPSILVDRLVELSPNNGTLVFIYPTKSGARTFTDEYLSPILDPLLRSIVVVNGLSSNLSTALGRMIAVDQMAEFDQLQRSMSALCAKLTQKSSSMQRLHGKRATFSLAHSSKEKIDLKREVWSADWWAKQEKQRIRDAMTRYTQEAAKKSSNQHVDKPSTSTELVQHLLDGVVQNPYPANMKQLNGVEVGVFVIQRTD